MDISSLRERRDASYTVSELNGILKNLIENDRALKTLTVKGEISNLTAHRSGHIYFTLKDEESQIKAVMFRSSAQHLKFAPENGMKVIVRASVGVYTQGGMYQLYVTQITPDGIGALYLAYEQLKARLDAEGLFLDGHKKPLPKYPTKIGVITSPTGAAVRDIINVITRRFPIATIYLYPSLVQGDGAEDNLIEAVDFFDQTNLVDLIIIGRGGGSLEDLYSFNSEALARRIFACKIPVISAVGHETDFTICDFVADKRAPTPSAAAELAVPDIRELSVRLDMLIGRISGSMLYKIERGGEKLKALRARISSSGITEEYKSLIKELKARVDAAAGRTLDRKKARLAELAAKINALSPLSVLSRGYCVLNSTDKAVRTVNDVEVGQSLSARLNDGVLSLTVDKKELLK